MNLGLEGKRALVLGASRGLGLAIARSLAAEGAEVVLCGRDEAALQAAVAGISAQGGRASAARLDLADAQQRRATLEQLLAQGKGFDILINNGGGPAPGAISAVEPDSWRQAFESMIVALFEVTNLVLPGMRERGWGRIINIVSSGVVQPIPNLGVSNALRASVVGWAKTLAAEVAAQGVTVNAVIPGRIATERVGQLDEAAAKRGNTTAEAVAEASRKTIPMGRYGNPEEFADTVVFLASERASYITGSTVRVDGGMIRSI
ncbi:SDR family oxidoreductase [Pseudomonas typographi]|uniref:SDR family oxidoreductase n=1 Tax=Pseudomonas typographi TaxID=2715964 RepID=A0ABR7Z480_9PSED|nr:SDR family oxidoreductase [Pseudomonas typographi]MBD1552937.1 SDR family oxidoreductase [Pseudomonas typographi]MBD1588312.1 SDR family oxidoreductase [Pseudomonas typographi]MBD1600283.1 SDR family oxidoreductase [Pseudomonas typographi]